MKSRIRHLGRVALFGVFLLATDAYAQAVVGKTATETPEKTVVEKTVTETDEQSVTITTMTSSGTISELGPGTLVVKTTTSGDPVRYAYTKATIYVDEHGKAVSIEELETGLPVTVYSDKSGNEMVAIRVVATRAIHPDPFHD
jgi:hypothetical protein